MLAKTPDAEWPIRCFEEIPTYREAPRKAIAKGFAALGKIPPADSYIAPKMRESQFETGVDMTGIQEPATKRFYMTDVKQRQSWL